jgi:hypothetical protein
MKLNSINKIKKIVCLKNLALLIFVVGCVPGPLVVGTEDVSIDDDLWYGFKYYKKYILKEDVFLSARDTKTPSRLVLVPPREKTKGIYTLHYSAPLTVTQYKENNDRWPGIQGIVSAGTTIQCSKLVRYNAFGYGNSLYIFAVILEGPYSGIEAEISDLSLVGPEHKSGVYLNTPNLKLITPVNKE